jgi:rod shape-determining protein MreB
MSRKAYGIDFGTSMIKIYKKGQGVLLDEKNIIAIADRKKVIAVGNEAYDMFEKAPGNISVSYPVKCGVVADIQNMQALLDTFIARINSRQLFGGRDFYVAVPNDITDVEKRAFYDLIANSNAKAKNIWIVEKPIADATGADLDVTTAQGVMIIDIGAETTEISILSLGGIVLSKLIPVGGRKLDETIKLTVKKKYGLVIGDKTAESIKKQLASAVLSPTESMKVYGRDVVSGLPTEMDVDSDMVFESITEHLTTIIENIKVILERTPPEISADIIDSGIYITGGSSQIRRLDELISAETGLRVNLVKDPENSVVNGMGKIMEEPSLSELASSLKQSNYSA